MDQLKIINIHTSYSNILITDSEKKLWIMGSNDDKKTGLGKANKHLYIPVNTGIQLMENDRVKYFYCYTCITIIYTHNGYLFVSQTNKKKKKHIDALFEEIDTVDSSSEEISSDDSPDILSGICFESNNSTNEIPLNSNHNFFFNHQNPIPPKEPYGLVSSGVDGIIVSHQIIIFVKKNKIFVYDPLYNRKDIIINKGIGLSVIERVDYNITYYELMFPFSTENITICDTFIYFQSGNFHHVLFIPEGGIGIKITWLYFTTKFKINHSDIFTCSYDSSIFVKKSNDIYKYDHETHTISKLLKYSPIKIFPLITNDGSDTIFCTLQKDGLWMVVNTKYKKICDYNQLLYQFVDLNYDANDGVIILIDSKDHPRYTVYGNNIYINVHNINYKLTDSGLIYYEDGTIFYCTNMILAEQKYNTMEIDTIETDKGTYYMYTFINVPDDPEKIIITNEMILLMSKGKHYYRTIMEINDDDFQINKFMEIILQPQSLNTVSKHLVIRQNKYYESTVELCIGISSDKLSRLMNIVELLNLMDTGFSIVYVDKSEIISHGDGPKREFIESAIIQFKETYLSDHDINTIFNMENVTNLTEDSLFYIGIILHMVICDSENPLPIRLPLSILKEIKKESPTTEELEFFLERDIPDIFHKIKYYKNNPTEFVTLDSDFDNYYDLINDLCGIRKKYENISKYIMKGFLKYSEIRNLEMMNYMTLDYYISGKITVDRTLLLKKIKVSPFDYYVTMSNIIDKLSDDQLMILLTNWSGSKVVRQNNVYQIIVTDNCLSHDVTFTTCNITLNISKKIMDDIAMREILITLLITPIQTMVN